LEWITVTCVLDRAVKRQQAGRERVKGKGGVTEGSQHALTKKAQSLGTAKRLYARKKRRYKISTNAKTGR